MACTGVRAWWGVSRARLDNTELRVYSMLWRAVPTPIVAAASPRHEARAA